MASTIHIDAMENQAVVLWLAANSKYSVQASRVWAILLTHTDKRSGRVLLNRDHLSQLIGQNHITVNVILSELSSIGALIKIKPVKYHALTQYSMNPKVATWLVGKAREAAIAAAPPGPQERVDQQLLLEPAAAPTGTSKAQGELTAA